jgi:hypothetical protein
VTDEIPKDYMICRFGSISFPFRRFDFRSDKTPEKERRFILSGTNNETSSEIEQSL